MRIGYNNKPRNWYEEQDIDVVDFVAETEPEKALDELTPDGEKQLFKSHLERGGVESKRPHEVMMQKFEDDSYHREVYKRKIDDLDTSDPSIQELRDAEYKVEVIQGNSSAFAHRYDELGFEGLPDEVQQVFKTHDDKYWAMNQ